MTQLLPEEDRHAYSRTQLLGQISMMLGGRAAEELTFNQFTTGASNDIQKATELARRMVVQWGMSENIGPISYSEGPEQVFLGRDLIQHKMISEKTTRRIDHEVRAVISRAYDRALKLLKAKHKALITLAETLIEHETVDGKEVDEILDRCYPATATA